MSFMNNKGIPNVLTGGQGGMMNALSSLEMKPGMNKPVAQGQGGALTNVLSSIENWGQNNLRRGSGPLAEAFHGFAQGFAPQQYENARQGRMGEIAQEQARRGDAQQQITGMNEQQAQMQREMQESALAMGQHLLTMPEEQRVAFVRQNWQRFGPMVSGGKNNMSFDQWIAQDPTGLSDMDLQNDIAAAMTQMRQGPQYEVTNDQYIRMDQGAPRVALDARDAVTVDPGDRLATQTGQVLLGPDEEYVNNRTRETDAAAMNAQTNRMNANTSAARLQADIEAASRAPQVDPGDEIALRNEYNRLAGDFRDTQAAFTRIQAIDTSTAAGQMALVFNYMKMLDPGSTVREGEYASVRNAAGIDDRIRNLYNSMLSGQQLTPEQVQDVMSQINNIYFEAEQSQRQLEDTYQGYAQRYGYHDSSIPSYTGGYQRGADGAVSRTQANTQPQPTQSAPPPSGVPPELWNVMTPEERAAWE